MNYEDRLQQAKQEKSLSDAPLLRRAVLLTRWFGLLGGIFLMISAIRGLIAGADLMDETAVPMMIAAFEAVLAASIFTLSRMTNSAAGRYDMGRLFTVLGRLKAVLITKLALVFGTMLYLMILVSGAGAKLLPFLITLLLPAIIIFMWIRDITRGRSEIRSLPNAGANMPPALKIATRKRTKAEFLRFCGVIAAVSAVCSALCAGCIWYLATYRTEWFTEHFTGKPLGLIEPLEMYDRYRISKGSVSIWDQWTGDLYAEATGRPNPYPPQGNDMDPSGSPSDEAAFAAFNAYVDGNPEISRSLNHRAFFIDVVAYLVVFCALGAGTCILLGYPASKVDSRTAPPPPV